MEAPTAPTAKLTGGDLAIRAEVATAAIREEARADRRLAAFLRNPRRAGSLAA